MIAILVMALVLMTVAFVKPEHMQAATSKEKLVIVASLKGNALKYHKAGRIDTEYTQSILEEEGFENIIGYGKKQTIKVSSNCKYYLWNYETMEPYKVSKKKFKNSLYDYSKETTQSGKVWYWGMAVSITIKNGKVIKMVQNYQA